MLRALLSRRVVVASSSMTLRRGMASLAPLDASKLTITKTTSPKEKLPKEKLVFGRSFTDHMLTIKYTKEEGWEAPAIVPYGNLSLSPASNSLHYAIECFEGMKAYIDGNGKIRLFRPDMNMERLNNSARRIQLPEFDGDQLIECLKALLRIDKDWIPRQRGFSLYIRPTMIGTQDSLGVGPSNSALLYIILSPVGPYYASGFEPVNLFASDKYVRAWPGGTGNTKLGCNYAPGILPQVLAAKDGFAQILWLFGEKHNITEVGTMNAFTAWKNKRGERELITPPLDGTILPGVTRDSILQLAKNWKDIQVVERPYTIHDVLEALEEKRLLEFFGAGTAAIVAPVKGIQYNNKLHQIPLDVSNPAAKAGPIASRLLEEILAIQYGEVPNHPWSVLAD